MIYKIAETQDEFEQIFEIRKSFFVDIHGFPIESMNVSKNNIHIIAKRDNSVVGTVTILTDDLPVAKFLKLPKAKNAEISKLATRDNRRIGIILLILTHCHLQKLGYDNMFFFSYVDRLLSLYKKLGSKRYGRFRYMDHQAEALILDLNKNYSGVAINKAKEIYSRYFND